MSRNEREFIRRMNDGKNKLEIVFTSEVGSGHCEVICEVIWNGEKLSLIHSVQVRNVTFTSNLLYPNVELHLVGYIGDDGTPKGWLEPKYTEILKEFQLRGFIWHIEGLNQ